MHPGVAVNFVGRTSWERMVRLDVRVVEFRRGALRDLGIRWRDDITGPQGGIIADFITNDRFRLPSPPGGVPDVSNTRAHSPKVYLGLSTVLDSRLRFLERQGDAWIIAEPSLSCRSGGAARFVSGGEIPIPIVNAQGATDVEFREYGIILDVKPIADASGAIYARIDTEISQIDPSQRVLDVPGLLKRRSMSEFNLRAGETLVLAGLVSRASSNERSGVPGLTQVPAAGALFSERNRRRERTELAVFITPSLAQPTPVTIPASGSSQALESLPQRAEQAWRSSSMPGPTQP
jgi:pilus assembly protein CpaC